MSIAIPNVVPREGHTISRRNIDPDALKVLYRLKQSSYVAYLVGGGVRDLLLNQRPKDFDIGTSAHPYQVKRLFRNCWVIGRRFRLAHVKFGNKIIEVATFRRQVTADAESVDTKRDPTESNNTDTKKKAELNQSTTFAKHQDPDRLIRRDNTFGTPAEDAFRRDFTINALFYDIETFSVIDYVNGLDDLKAGVIRCIGDPSERFLEDPVRMLRAITFSARLNFTIEPKTLRGIRRHKREISKSAPARLLEEIYKILRSGNAETTFLKLKEIGLLEQIIPELSKTDQAPLQASLARLDSYRRKFETAPETLNNSVLLGSLVVPLGFTGKRPPRKIRDGKSRRPPVDIGLRSLPVARRNADLLCQILGLQSRLTDRNPSSRSRNAIIHRTAFPDALTWLEIHGGLPELISDWRQLLPKSNVRPRTDRPTRRRHRKRAPRANPKKD